MLYDFLEANRKELIARCVVKAARRTRTKPLDAGDGIPQFIEQLIETLRSEHTPEALARHKAEGARRPSLSLVPPSIASTAARHGDAMRRQGLTIDQVVHDYGDLCQALTELALEKDVVISVDEFHTFNRCLDNAIADAATAFTRQHPVPFPDATGVDATSPSPEQQVRDLLETAILSFGAIRAGQVGLKGTTSSLHEKTLLDLRDLLGSVLVDSRPDPDAGKAAGSPP